MVALAVAAGPWGVPARLFVSMQVTVNVLLLVVA
jgi:hypothetical protein